LTLNSFDYSIQLIWFIFSPSLGLSDTEEHFEFTPDNGVDSHQKVQQLNSEGFQFGSNNNTNNTNSGSNSTNGNSRQSFQQRNTWLRSSLRRSGYAYSLIRSIFFIYLSFLSSNLFFGFNFVFIDYTFWWHNR